MLSCRVEGTRSPILPVKVANQPSGSCTAIQKFAPGERYLANEFIVLVERFDNTGHNESSHQA
ncbi:MAG: hypothetical protein ABI379_00205 [Rhodanobacter sp.]